MEAAAEEGRIAKPTRKAGREAWREEIEENWLASPIGMDDEDERTWEGVAFLGAGSYGSAGLWVQTDDSGNILRVRFYSPSM